MANRYRRQSHPPVAPNLRYVPTRNTQKPPFYQEIEGASQWAVDSKQWEGFVRDVVQMPATMIPAVREAIRQQRWKIAPIRSHRSEPLRIKRLNGWASGRAHRFLKKFRPAQKDPSSGPAQLAVSQTCVAQRRL